MKREIIDVHAHIYPDAIAEKASRAIGEFYDFDMPFSGSVSSLIFDGERAGITHYVVHSVATTAHQVGSINNFISTVCAREKRFTGYCTLHPDMTEERLYDEVSSAIKSGLKGIKLHPDFQRFDIDGAGAYKIYRAAADRLPILLHTGDDRYDYSAPRRLVKAAKDFPHTTFIGAHFGAYRVYEEMPVYLGLDNVYFDTSSALYYLSVPEAKGYIRLFGAERFFFGTDFPMWKAKDEVERFLALGLTSRENELIFSANAKSVLGIET